MKKMFDGLLHSSRLSAGPSLPTHLTLTQRLAFLLVGLTMVSAFLVSVVVQAQLRGVLLENEGSQLVSRARLSAAYLESSFKRPPADVQALAHSPAVDGLVRARQNSGTDPESGLSESVWESYLSAEFIGVLVSEPDYLQLRFIGLADGGKEILRVERSAAGETPVRIPPANLQRKGERTYLKETSNLAEGEVYVSPIERNQEFGKIQQPIVPVFRAATPVYDIKGKLFGILIINVDLRRIFRQFREADLSLLVDEKGEYLVHWDPTREFSLSRTSTGFLQEAPTLSKTLQDNRISLSAEYDGAEFLAASSTVELPDADSLMVIELETRAEALASSRAVQRSIALGGLGAIVLAIFLAWRLAVYLGGPWERMTRAIESYPAAQDLEKLIQSPGEVGMLARAFHDMANTVEENEKKLKESNLQLSEFAMVASHDLQAPLRGIIGYLELLEKKYSGRLDERADKYIQFAVTSSRRLQNLVQDLLAYSRLEATKREFQSVDTAKLVTTVLEDLQVSVSGAQVETVSLPEVWGDPGQLTRLFQNLISNSLKFCQGVPELKISAERSKDARWLFKIEDNGIGISERQLPQVFDRFYRGHPQDEFEGTGLGMAAVKRIVEHHQGEIWLESEVDRGTTVFFTLSPSRGDQPLKETR